ncbi:hypothetical protein Scep_016878 [Stephania cephalantha]|uniref:Uncharacterized protein n=1 Tax=Stephania cephalantha TaxID=152367 RepID=A0AAP0IPF3_9MAGN
MVRESGTGERSAAAPLSGRRRRRRSSGSDAVAARRRGDWRGGGVAAGRSDPRFRRNRDDAMEVMIGSSGDKGNGKLSIFRDAIAYAYGLIVNIPRAKGNYKLSGIRLASYSKFEHARNFEYARNFKHELRQSISHYTRADHIDSSICGPGHPYGPS